MTDSTGTPSAPTDQKVIERIATEVMGWEINSEKMHKVLMNRWNPLEDWNNLRQVEEKVMEDEDLFKLYLFNIDIDKGSTGIVACNVMKSDLRTRCRALLSALDSLQTN